MSAMLVLAGCCTGVCYPQALKLSDAGSIVVDIISPSFPMMKRSRECVIWPRRVHGCAGATCSEFLGLLGHHHILILIKNWLCPSSLHSALDMKPWETHRKPAARSRDSATLIIGRSKVTYSHIKEHYRCDYNLVVNSQHRESQFYQRKKRGMAMSAG